MCVGNRPWAGMSHAAIIRAVCIEHRELLFGDETPGGVVHLAQACLSYNPAQRPTFQDVMEVLEPLRASVMGCWTA